MIRLIIYLLLLFVVVLPGNAYAYLDPTGASIFWQIIAPVFVFLIGFPLLFFRFIKRKIADGFSFVKNLLTRKKKSE